MAVKKQAKTVVEVEAPVVEAKEKPILVAEAEIPTENATDEEQPAEIATKEGDTLSATDNAQIFGPQPVEGTKSSKKIFWVLIILFTLLGAAAGGMGIYLQNRGSKASPSPTPEAMASPTSTPMVELDKTAISIQILNGSGITGAAKAAQDYLEGQGYTISAVGNADSSDYEAMIIAVKDDKKDYFAQLKKALATKYTVEDQADMVASSIKYDVVITIGKE